MNQGERVDMYRSKFVSLVEDHAELLTQRWLDEVKTNPSTAGYKKLSDEVLSRRVYDVYKRLGEWMLQEQSGYKQTAQHFIELGRDRAKEGLHVSEVVYAFILTRVILWKYVVSAGLIDTTLDFHQALDFYQKVTNFFDKAEYFVAVGYETLEPREQQKLDNENFVEEAVKSVMNWFVKEDKQ